MGVEHEVRTDHIIPEMNKEIRVLLVTAVLEAVIGGSFLLFYKNIDIPWQLVIGLMLFGGGMGLLSAVWNLHKKLRKLVKEGMPDLNIPKRER